MTDIHEIKPCPFCGGSDIDTLGRTFECCQCDATGPSQTGRHGWNHRATEATEAALLARAEVAEAKVVELENALRNMVLSNELDPFNPSNAFICDNSLTEAKAALEATP